ncbi:MAG: hypothetical protein EAZ59_08885 [Oscillatoriales cyanobacterium]|nr:MAG: hypothetical protein EAZ96_05670 [Oscillatoriales cyanobacterium]TAF69351.1 MAG: hypothetical protein EAZ59_08885 [Oscillatoriales cyanobacterium]
MNGDNTGAWSCAESVADVVAKSSATGYITGDELHLRDEIYGYPQFRCADVDDVEFPILRADIVG